MYQHEALPGALAQFVGTKARIQAIKMLRANYGFVGLKEGMQYISPVIPPYHRIPIHPEVILQDNPYQETIDNLQDAQRQLVDALDHLKQVTSDITNRDAQNSLRHYIIPSIECAITEDHGWLSSDDNIDSVLRGMEEQDD